MAFQGTTDSPARNTAQGLLVSNIGNDGTRARSMEIGIRAEAAVFERMGKRADGEYEKRVQGLVERLKDPAKGFELNRKLLMGELNPEKWVEKFIPEKRVELAKKKSEGAAVAAPLPSAVTAAATATTTTTTAPITVKPEDSGKKTDSTYYHFASTPKAQAEMYKPKKLEDPASIEEKVAQIAKAKGVSTWNTGGTWEDRDMTKWAHETLKDALKGVAVPAFADGECTISDSWTITGDASVVMVRGKKKIGFELKLKTTFSGQYKGEDVTGDIKIEHWDESEDAEEADVNITCKANTGNSQVVRRAARKAVSAIYDRMESFKSMFKETTK